jgi:hypothetical protein
LIDERIRELGGIDERFKASIALVDKQPDSLPRHLSGTTAVNKENFEGGTT